MGRLLDLYAKLKRTTVEEQEREILAIVKTRSNQMIDLNTAQLFAGKDSLGQSLRAYSNPHYADFKKSLNPAGVTDLKLTGAFYEGFFVKTDSWPIEFDSKDGKTPKLGEKYGDAIFGLDDKSKATLAEDIKSEVQKYYQSLLSVP